MSLMINLVISGIVYAYVFTAAVNFFHPITKGVSSIIILAFFISSGISIRYMSWDMFIPLGKTNRVSKIWIGLGLFCLLGWFFMVIFRPAADVDANVYQLPLAILMNHSVWYPGIGKLSSLYGFPNGNSVLSSLFTSFCVVGFENIPNMIIWVILGRGIFLYLTNRGITVVSSFFISLLFLFTPDLFWRSYNMGTDLGCACFLVFGFFALRDRKFEDCVLFFSLAAVFKTLGMIAFILTMAYIVAMKLFKKDKINLLHPKMILADVLFVVFLIRIFVATGNPLYPAFSLNFASWGIDSKAQTTLIEWSIRIYSGVKHTFPGFLNFVKDFILNPKDVKSSYWFSLFFTICFFLSGFVFFKQKLYRKINAHYGFISFLIFILFAVWFITSPLFRFISGVLIFITLELFIIAYRYYTQKIIKAGIYACLFFTLLLFMLNAAKHIKEDVIPFVFSTPARFEKLLPYKKEIFSIERTADGFEYTKSSSTYCGRVSLLPCINSYSLGEPDKLIQEYRKYNKLY